jgi:hypothetical protein
MNYDDWLRAFFQRAPGPGMDAYGRGDDSSYKSDAGNTATEQATQDIFNDHKNPKNYLYSMIPGYNNVRGAQGYQSWKGAKAKKRAIEHRVAFENEGHALDASRANAMQDGDVANEFERRRALGQTMSPEEIQQMLGQNFVKKTQEGLSNDVENYYASPERTNEYQQVYKDTLDNDNRQVTDQFNQALKSSVQGTARQGLQGGSVDYSRRGNLDRARSTAYVNAEQDAYGAKQGLMDEDESSKQGMLSSINSGDPYQAMSAHNTLLQAQSGGDALRRRRAAQTSSRDLNTFSDQMMSQAYAQPVNGATDWLAAYYRRPGTGA